MSNGVNTAGPPGSGIHHVARLRSRFAFTMTAIIVGLWACYLLLIPFAHGTLALQPLRGVSLAYFLGVSIIVLAMILTGIYVYWANRVYDPARAQLRAKGGK